MNSSEVEPIETIRGELGLGTLPALIRRLYEDRCTGTLHLHVYGTERRVHFQWGAVIFAGSDRKGDRLDHLLKREKRVEPEMLLEGRRLQESTGKRFGECLIELGALTEDGLLAAVERQVRSIVTYLFSLDRGEYWFEETDDPVAQDLILDLPMSEIILDGIRSMDDPIALRIGVGAMTDYLHVGRVGHGGVNVNAAEGFVLSRVDGRTNILDILSVSPLSEVDTLRSICALLAVGIVEAKREPLELAAPPPEPEPDEEPPPPPPEPEPSVQNRKELSSEDRRRAAEQHYQEGRRRFAEKKFYEAIGALMEAIRLDGTRAPYHRLLGEAYARNPKWKAAALEHLEEATRLDETDVAAHYSLGLLYEQKGRVQEARARFEKIVSLDPAHAQARAKLGPTGVFSRLRAIFKKSVSR